MRPLAKASTLMPPAALRGDPGVLLTAFARYLPSLLSTGPVAASLTAPFSKVASQARSCRLCSGWGLGGKSARGRLQGGQEGAAKHASSPGLKSARHGASSFPSLPSPQIGLVARWCLLLLALCR